jgi:hypothetical protein
MPCPYSLRLLRPLRLYLPLLFPPPRPAGEDEGRGVLFVTFVVSFVHGCRSLFSQPAGAYMIGPNSDRGRIVALAAVMRKLAARSEAAAAP